MSHDHSAPGAPGHPLALHLVEEISHRVANEYQEAISILSMAAARDPVAAGPALTSAAGRLRAQADVHRALLAPRAEGQVDLGNYVGRLCGTMARASLDERQIRLTLKTDDVWLEATRCWRVGLILSELLRNAVRHGLAGKSGAVGIDITRDGERIRCVVGDNGRATADPPEGRGRSLVRALAAELGGSVDWWFSQSGSFARLEIPVVPFA
jgi:two-component sensor histidine kinase